MNKQKQKPALRTIQKEARALEFDIRKRHVTVLLDKVLFLRFLRTLHGRFWGIAGVSIMILGFSVCFAIRPDMLRVDTAFSDFGNDVRTAPYFAGSVFFAAYGMWRWQKYLARTWKRGMPITGLIWLTVLGLYLIALMPVGWYGLPHKLHMFGVMLAGGSMLATVIVDWLLTKPRRGSTNWRMFRIVSIACIICGGWLTFGSMDVIGLYNLALLGETFMLAGYLFWITIKTYQGEGNRTALSRMLKHIVLVD